MTLHEYLGANPIDLGKIKTSQLGDAITVFCYFQGLTEADGFIIQAGNEYPEWAIREAIQRLSKKAITQKVIEL
jgi:hypothetical protein